jgi:monovalent cation/hydrogen antiporter
VFLPFVSNREKIEGADKHYISIQEAKRKILLAAIRKIREEINEKNEAAGYELMAEYKRKFHQIQPSKYLKAQYSHIFQQQVTEIRLMALKVERIYIHDLMEKKGLDEEVFATFEKALDHREEALSNNARSRTLYLLRVIKRTWGRFWLQYRKDKEKRVARLRVSRGIQLKSLQAALEFLEEYANKLDKITDAVNLVIVDYKRIINQLKRPASRYNEKSEEQKEEMRLRVMDIERAEIHRMYEFGQIDREQTKELRKFINYIESVTLYEHVE